MPGCDPFEHDHDAHCGSFVKEHMLSLLTPCRAQNGALSSGDRIPVPLADMSQTVAALVLAGGSSDNPLARARAMPALEIGRHVAILRIRGSVLCSCAPPYVTAVK